MTKVELTKSGAVFVLSMVGGENRFNPEWLTEFGAALDEVEASDVPAALVTTGQGKFYTNGLDLDWLVAQEPPKAIEFVSEVIRVFARLVAFPMVTVAAMNGHSFAGGGMLALAHDFRVMRQDRGYFCLPEVDLGMPLAPGMSALIRSRLTASTVRESILTGRRFAAGECLERGIVDATAAENDVLGEAVDRAAAMVEKDRSTMRSLKEGLYGDALAVMRGDQGSLGLG